MRYIFTLVVTEPNGHVTRERQYVATMAAAEHLRQAMAYVWSYGGREVRSYVEEIIPDECDVAHKVAA